MATIQETLDKISQPAELGKFLSGPKAYIKSEGHDPDDKKTAETFELYAKSVVSSINASNNTIGSKVLRADWGIGAGCCNATVMERIVAG